MPDNDFDVRDLPSWEYFAWGLLNGLFLGIALKEGIDISEVGILSIVLDAFKPLFEQAHLSTGWITLSIILLGIIGIVSLIGEAIIIYNKGWAQRIIAICGFLTFPLLLFGIDTLGVIVMILGILLVVFFPDK